MASTPTIYDRGLDTVISTQLTKYWATEDGQNYTKSIDMPEVLTETQRKTKHIASQIANMGWKICLGIFAACFIVAVVLSVLSFPAAIVAIPSAIGLLVFLVPAIARIIQNSLEFQSKDETKSRRIVHTVDQREGKLRNWLKGLDMVSLFKNFNHDSGRTDQTIHADLSERMKAHFPHLSAQDDGISIIFKTQNQLVD